METEEMKERRAKRHEENRLAARILQDAMPVDGSLHTRAGPDRLGFQMTIGCGAVVDFKGFDFRHHADCVVHGDGIEVAIVHFDPKIFVDPAIFGRRAPLYDMAGRPSMTEAEFVAEIAQKLPEFYRRVVDLARGMTGKLPATGRGVAALKATAFITYLRKAGLPPETWVHHADRSTLWPDPVEAREVRRVVDEESLAAMQGHPTLWQDPPKPKPPAAA